MDALEITDDASPAVCSFNNLPDEILEYVLRLLPPYKDLQNCMCVSKRWHSCCTNVLRKTENDLYKAIVNNDIAWRTITPLDMAPTITKRFSHAACVHENSMYIFGGCTTNSTAFNDLWRFDLSNRQWIRPLAMGTYPTPKAYATMIPYKDCLILFGGWAYPLSVPLYQDWTMSTEIHFYNTTMNRWVLLTTINNPPTMAGHSAVIRGDLMVVFGGLYMPSAASSYSSSNIWVLNLKTLTWVNQSTSDPKPAPRYGQSMMRLDDDHIMILGGIKAPKVYTDCWILRMTGKVWTWFEVNVKNKEWSASDVWCNPACKVGDKVITFGRARNGPTSLMHSIPIRLLPTDHHHANNNQSVSHRLEQNMRRLVDRDNNVNGRRGVLPHQPDNAVNNLLNKNELVIPRMVNDEPKPGPSGTLSNKLSTSILNNDQKPNSVIDKELKPNNVLNQNPHTKLKNAAGRRVFPNRYKLIKHIRDTYNFPMAAFSTDSSIHNVSQDFRSHRIANLAERLPERREVEVVLPPVVPAVKKVRRNTLALHVLDISTVLSNNSYSSVSWMPPQKEEVEGAPEEVIMYSLVHGKGELIMFGGLYCNCNNSCMLSKQFSNSLHFIMPPKDIV